MSDEIKNEGLGEDTQDVAEVFEKQDDLSTEESAVDTGAENTENTVDDAAEDGDDAAEEESKGILADQAEKKKKKKEKKKLTPEQKKKRTIKALTIVASIVLVFGIFIASCAIANKVGSDALIKQAMSFEKVQYAEGAQMTKENGGIFKDEDGYWTFKSDRDLKIVQFTDVHIGGGCFSQKKDAWAMNAVATMIRGEKPDLVIVTGDIAYPVPFQAGTFNNLTATKIFANLMESLGVYWTFAFGNHDTEAYSMYTRREICEYYEGAGFEYCLFDRGYSSEELGYGNSIIKVQNNDGITTQALVTLDSHSYIDGDYFGAAWKYDIIHREQSEWYAEEMDKLVAANVAKGGKDEPVENFAFFHIPLKQYRDAWKEFRENNNQNTDNVKLIYGSVGESDGKKNGVRTWGVFCGLHSENETFFDTGIEHGLRGTFSGHDHFNNFSLEYKVGDKSVRLTYGASVDYLAYAGIYKEHGQRGCTVISIKKDGSEFECHKTNYYEDYGVGYEAQ